MSPGTGQVAVYAADASQEVIFCFHDTSMQRSCSFVTSGSREDCDPFLRDAWRFSKPLRKAAMSRHMSLLSEED
jgi:hypothetical protein